MEPMLPTDEDTNCLFDRVVLELQSSLRYSMEEASDLVHRYYAFFTDEKSCDSIGVPVQDDDYFFHESVRGMALRIYYYLVLKEDPNPSAFIDWRTSLYEKYYKGQ